MSKILRASASTMEGMTMTLSPRSQDVKVFDAFSPSLGLPVNHQTRACVSDTKFITGQILTELYREERAASISASVISTPFIIPFSFTRRALEGVAFLSIDDLSKAISRSIAEIRLMVSTSCFSAVCFNFALLLYYCCINLTCNKYIVKKGEMSLI